MQVTVDRLMGRQDEDEWAGGGAGIVVNATGTADASTAAAPPAIHHAGPRWRS